MSDAFPALPSIPGFAIARLPRIEFGSGALARLPDIAAGYGRNLLLVTGLRSLAESVAGKRLFAQLAQRGLSWEQVRVSGEPSPEWIDATVAAWRERPFDCVVGIGGGSALDAAKAIAGLLRPGNSVMEHLEGVGPELPYLGPAIPLIAVPTTAGTGSEATKNAVLSVPGSFKKSFRDDRLVAEWAIVDPDLLAACPPELIAADGLDAFTQLLESFVSTRANPLTDALARSGIMAARAALPALHRQQSAAARAQMAYASLLSGICLAQTGLGSVHGLASPLGAFFPIPHGVVCGTLVASATARNITALEAREPDNPALPKYAEVGRRFAMQKGLNGPDARRFLVDTLRRWELELALPRLSAYGIGQDDLPRIVAASRGSSMKTNPIVLSDAELTEILASRL
ncbi:iron-containing alcohol dehydrogenase [Candidatus Accumulibacter contiguus]|jgi:alcohol dehydrogenase class IV|uniref:Iron-containing alcohol dehydrogenase n=1 Tax=Candidatus Accumulibacter contiguus TaxID=2954381 RepID=A0ABX1T6Q1_9PROT|nr:iron-containing alcohol dehydrogenase [Candidatus Accumulibacter contiguus]NMQ05329.1 iron-containing alcohol dehydrogenase [Candidatus Accumulibacter contiguus]